MGLIFLFFHFLMFSSLSAMTAVFLESYLSFNQFLVFAGKIINIAADRALQSY
jgi:hypothetical protein